MIGEWFMVDIVATTEEKIAVSEKTTDTSPQQTEENTLFQKREGNTVKFYSDAYEDETKTKGAFADLFKSIVDAKESIVITGWALSPDHKFKVDVEGQNGLSVHTEMTLPQLLARKAAEGTDVVVLGWKNITPDFKKDTDQFIPALRKAAEAEAARTGKKPREILEKLNVKFSSNNLGFSDHAKMVIVDSKELYMGGLDLTKNRDEVNTWRDCHAKFTGPVVEDAIELVQARWIAQSKSDSPSDQRGASILQKAKELAKELVRRFITQHNLKYDEKGKKVLDEVKTASTQANTNAPATTSKVQLLTSVREEFWGLKEKWVKPEKHKDTHTRELQTAYLDAVKKAEKFIYMENQFFIGRTKTLKTGEQVESSNPIVKEIAEKIKSKIRSGEEFHFYCQLPFRPEGENPKDVIVQSVLREQWKTMDWLRKEIQEELAKNPQNQSKVEDYLTFYNLGFQGKDKGDADHGYTMKYTHSKLMIVDDKDLIIGSANCNERSMAGNRDHEVIMRVQDDSENSKIKEFRINNMKQHFGNDIEEAVKKNPESLGPDGKPNPGSMAYSKEVKGRLHQNLGTLQNSTKPIATPWGNTTEGVKPRHVPDRMPKLMTATSAALPKSIGERLRK